MSGNPVYIPGTDSQSTISVETVLIRLPKTGSSSHKLVALQYGYAHSSTEGFRLAPRFPGRFVNCAKQGQPPGFPPALRRTGRVSGFRFPSSQTESTSGEPLGLQGSVRSGGMSLVFCPEQACRRKSMDCWVCSRIPLLGIQLVVLLSRQFRQLPRSKLGLREHNRADYSHHQRRLNRHY